MRIEDKDDNKVSNGGKNFTVQRYAYDKLYRYMKIILHTEGKKAGLPISAKKTKVISGNEKKNIIYNIYLECVKILVLLKKTIAMTK